uniref:Regucalcin n=1 Tax=Lygus hesperus TaxID=30085 RepID=A0A0K8TA38_LYGHE
MCSLFSLFVVSIYLIPYAFPVDAMYKIERLNIDGLGLVEGPHWDVETQSLFFVDLRVGKINMYTPATKRFISIKTWDGTTSFIIPVRDRSDHFVVGEKLNVTLIHWDVENNKIVSKQVLATMPDKPTNRLNDGKCDSSGRLWLGTMSDARGKDIKTGAGSFYSYSKNEGVKLQLKNITISNGIAQSLDNKKFWYVDSTKYRIDEYDFNIDKGEIGNFKTVFDVKKNNILGLPDGMTIDSDGNLWLALFGGARVIEVNPSTGKLLRTIDIPTAHQITSVAFGGPNLDELYVTSANVEVSPEEAAKYTERGSTFRVTGLGVKGLPATSIDLSI